MAVNNATIIEKAVLNGSNDFYQRIGESGQASLERSVEHLLDYNNSDMFSEFTNLTNIIAKSFVNSKVWDNPFRFFFKDRIIYGNGVRQIACDFIESHSFDPNSANVFEVENPGFAEWFFSINRQQVYKWSINRTDLRRALAAPGDSTAINQLYAAKATSAINSNENDIYNSCIQLIAMADEKWNNGAGLYKKQMNAVVDKASAQTFLANVRADISVLKWPSKTYNNADIAIFAKPEELCLLLDPYTKANCDVYALAELFNIDKAEIPTRIIEVREFPMPGAFALLTTRDFFQLRDTVYTVENIYNPGSLTENFWLHSQGSLAINPLVPCILYTTDTGTVTPTVKVDITGMNSEIVETGHDSNYVTTEDIANGVMPFIKSEYIGTVEGGTGKVTIPAAGCTYEITAKDGLLNSRTYVDDSGYIHIQKNGIEAGDVLTISCTGAYINPSGVTANVGSVVTLNIQ